MRAAVIGTIAVGWSLFQAYTALFGVLPALQQRAIHLTFALVLAFLTKPWRKRSAQTGFGGEQVILAALSAGVGGYVMINHMALMEGLGIYSLTELLVAGLGILLTLEAARRLTGWAMPLIAMVFIAYEFLGPVMPALVRHQGFSISNVVTYQFLSIQGVFGIALGVSASFVFLFILYAGFLQATGAGQVFIDLATALVGFVRGGPAKIAVLASCLFGSISGSAVANVVGTGTFTIPLMKRLGYRPHFAGAVEAVASSGGQIMPPIMGAAAFLIAEVLGIAYWKVALYALVPAVLFYLALFFMVDFEAARLGLVGMKRSELPRTRTVFRHGWPALLSPVVLVALLAGLQWSPQKAAMWAIIVTIAASFLTPQLRMTLAKLWEGLKSGALSAIDTAIACATVGLVIGAIMQTGLGIKLSSMLITISQGNLFILLISTAIASLILGMGLPTVAVYLVLSVMVAPALVQMGVMPLAAHLYIFYFGIIANITPPVALAAYAGSAIAGASFMQTGMTATRLGMSGFILPFMWVYGPQLILQGTPGQVAQAIITATIGTFSLSVALAGYLNKPISTSARLLFGISALLMIVPEVYTDLAGLAGFAALMVYLLKGKRSKQVPAVDRISS